MAVSLLLIARFLIMEARKAVPSFELALFMTTTFTPAQVVLPVGVGATTGSYMRAGFSVGLGVLVLGEALSTALIIGLVMIYAGVAIVTGHLKWPIWRLKKDTAS
ncbi:hypothetical protein [Boseongicola sp. H5]|uniref:hypothetical protein n=1 Tax=Boseongicola sp. H5 TaxID=2763261 RepID=UPI001D09D2EB|nr:hypothetical protein [Boseongicola sp. H5]